MTILGHDGKTAFWRTGHNGTLFGAFLYTEASFLVWIMLGPMAPFIADAFHLTAAQTTLLVALPILSGTVLQLPAGVLVDRFGPRRVGIAAQVLTLLTLFLAGNLGTDQIAGLYGAAALFGAAGVSFAVAMPLVSGWYPVEHQGKALGITALGGSGTLVTVLVTAPLADAFGWPALFAIAALPMGAALLAFLFLVREPAQVPPPRSLHQYLYVLRYSDTLWFCFFYAVSFGGVVSLASTLVLYFHDQFRLAPAAAGSLSALCIFGAALFRPVGGWLADHAGGIRTLQVAFATVIVSTAILALAPAATLSVSAAATFAALAALGTGNGALFQLIPIRFFRQMGVMTGLVGMAGGLGGFLLAFGFGQVRAVSGQHQSAFLIFGALAVVALIGLWSVKGRWRTTWGAPHATSARV